MRYLAKFSFVLLLVLVFCPMTAFTHTEDDPLLTQLIAGGGNPDSALDVGEVQVWNDGDYLYVKYIIDADLTPDDFSDDDVPTLITWTHLHVADDWEDIPLQNGNPVLGHFAYNMVHDRGVTEYTYQILMTWNPDTDLYVAAHAEVSKEGDLYGLELALPDTVTIQLTFPYVGEPAYFPTVTVSGGTILDGIYEG